MSVSELKELRAPLVSSDRAGYYDVLAFCKFVRDNHIRDEQSLVSKNGLRVLKSNFSSLGNEGYILAEQVCMALLDGHEFEEADYCLKLLEKKFGDQSNRVLRLRGMRLEYEGQYRGDTEFYTAATVVYQAVLEKDPTDSLALKRQISVAKSQGLRQQTMKLLGEYLKIFGADFEAWLELANLYLDAGMYQSAAFCMEELIVLQPQNYHYYVKYGEILSTLATPEALLLARKQFSFALELSQVNNLRAWWGLVTTANAITHASKAFSPKDIALSVSLFDLASTHITNATQSHKTHAHTLATLAALAPPPASRALPPSSPSPSTPPTSSLPPTSSSSHKPKKK